MKKILLILTVLGIAAGVYAEGQQEEAAAAASAPVVGVVEYLDGDVLIDGVQADFGMKVGYGAVVETGVDSYCEIKFDGKNVFRLRESTIAEIKLSVEQPEIAVKKGTFAAVFNKLEKLTTGQPFKVRTQTTVAGVRGTAFFVKAIDENNTYICICNGELAIGLTDGTEMDDPDMKTMKSGYHLAYYHRRVNGETVIEKASLEHHTNEEMEMLADHIGDNIEWYY